MIVTFTPNPSIDATVSVERLIPGEVLRVTASTREAGGKGINVANAAAKAGVETVAVAPTSHGDPFIPLVSSIGVPLRTVTVEGRVRTNTAITEADGRTTKVNESGPHLSEEDLEALEREVVSACDGATIAVLAGSLPPGAPADWYATLVRNLRSTHPGLRIAVDTSDQPLEALGRRLDDSAPDIIKPNAFELGQIAGTDGHDLESRADSGDFEPVLATARRLVERGVREVLVTLGGAGACLVTADGAWHAAPPPVLVRSTVGAGDSSLAGYVVASLNGAQPAEALRHAVAYGSAAASLPGTTIPGPDDIDLAGTTVRAL